MSLFIVFEGGDGSGKSTQAHHLAKAFKKEGIPFILTHEPGDTELGHILREALLDRNRTPMSKKAEALLFAADRAEHVEKIIRPALDRGEVVICDRYIASTVAYQVYGNELSREIVEYMSKWASGDLYPDVTFFLDIPPEIGVARACTVKKTRFEDKDLEFHRRVSLGFHEQIDTYWKKIDAQLSTPVIAEIVREHAFEMYRLKEEAIQVTREVFSNRVNAVAEHMAVLGFSQAEIDRISARAGIIKSERES